MGFMSGLGKVLKGEPVFTPQDGNVTERQAAAGKAESNSGKSAPVVMIGRIECHANGEHMDVWGDIHNGSSVMIFLDKINLLGGTHQLDTNLKPGDSRQFKLYSGPVPQSQPKGYAELQYRTEEGDYFMAKHVIEARQQDSGWIIEELELDTPIHDLSY